MTIGDGVFTLDVGDTLTFDGHEPHMWQNAGDEESIVLFVLVPGAGSGHRSAATPA